MREIMFHSRRKAGKVPLRMCALMAVVGLVSAAHGQERLPAQVAGAWRITRLLPARSGQACWTEKEAQPLVGSVLEYTQHRMRWQGGVVPLNGITTRSVSSSDLAEEAPAGEGRPALSLTDLGIQAKGVTEVNFQHEDADITGATTEVPGDSVLLAGPGRIVVSACGVYLEARRVVTRPGGRSNGERPSCRGTLDPVGRLRGFLLPG